MLQVLLLVLGLSLTYVNSSCLPKVQTNNSDLLLETPKGALISVSFDGEIGFLLDEIPNESDARKNVENYILNSLTETEWKARVERQISMTFYQQVYRLYHRPHKKQLTLPPFQVWEIKFNSEPMKKLIDDHDYVYRKYSFYSVLVAKENTIVESEPALVPVGGIFSDYWILPVDPIDLFQRTKYACINEAGFSSDTVTSDNAWSYFDNECDVEAFIPPENRTYDLNNARCHWTAFPKESCIEALEKYIGTTRIDIIWTRLPWSESEASKWRYGDQSSPKADLAVVEENLEKDLNTAYRFFDDDSCTLNEGGSFENGGGCIDKPGWRQLLRFTSTAVNTGKTDMHFGDVENSIYLKNNLFEYDDCHKHYHFQHYSKFQFGDKIGRKAGFCLQTTWRYHNNEWTSLNSPYDTCTYQGVSVGWGDDYYAGLDCQWIDVTAMEPGVYTLSNFLNNDGFMCEGVPNFEDEIPIFVATEFVNSLNETENKQECAYLDNYKRNNYESLNYNFSGLDSSVTLPCTRDVELSPTKDCGFELQFDNIACEPNKTTSIELDKSSLDSNRDAIIRVCESSKELGHSTYCEYVHALANNVYVGDDLVKITFQCPGKRSDREPGGLFSILVSTFIPGARIPKLRRI